MLAGIPGLEDGEIPLVRLPGGPELRNPSAGEVSRALGIGLDLDQAVTVDLLVVGGGPAGLGAAVYGASEGLDTLVVDGTALGGQAGTSRRIENYLTSRRASAARSWRFAPSARHGSSVPEWRRRTWPSRSSPAPSTTSSGSRAARR